MDTTDNLFTPMEVGLSPYHDLVSYRLLGVVRLRTFFYKHTPDFRRVVKSDGNLVRLTAENADQIATYMNEKFDILASYVRTTYKVVRQETGKTQLVVNSFLYRTLVVEEGMWISDSGKIYESKIPWVRRGSYERLEARSMGDD